MKKAIRKIWKHFTDFDRIGERKIKKANEYWNRGNAFHRILAIFLHNRNRRKYGCNIPPQVKIGQNFHILHCQNILFGETTEIGDNCRVYHSVTIIAKVKGNNYSAGIRRHARIGNDCLLGAGCMIIGDIEIGDDCIIGGGAIVTKNIPAHSVVKGINQIRPKRTDDYDVPPWLVNGKEVFQRGPEEYGYNCE